MFYTVFSTNDSPYMQWQSELLEYSWNRVSQDGVLIRLVATDRPQHLPVHKHAHCVATQLWDIHPDTGDHYPVYNKPASLLEWLIRDRPTGTVLLLDPDCVFRRPVTQRLAPGFAVSQQWVKFPTRQPGAANPFGLADEFAFLNDHCVRPDLAATPVMIPTLIHTSDLRKICARWLELCGIIRQQFLVARHSSLWEADMLAYLVASAEYGIQHQPASLGICTNWDPQDAPDAPLIHYCQPILDRNGQEIFSKRRYAPRTRIDTTSEPNEDYGRDLIRLVNDHVAALQAAAAGLHLEARPTRRNGVMEGRVADELRLELPAEARSIWLNVSGRAIWELCDASRTIRDIEAELESRFCAAGRDLTADVVSLVRELREAGFLEIR
jgi:hypothetical protein